MEDKKNKAEKKLIIILKKFITWRRFIEIATLFVAIWGLNILQEELRLIGHQNELTEISIRQTYRPTGVINALGDENIVKTYIPFYDENNKDNYYTKEKLNNKGKGVLFLIGVITFKNKKDINFYSKSLVQIIKGLNDEIEFDKMYEHDRMKSLLIDRFAGINILWYNVNLSQPGYLYGIILYKDQSNNLYSTIIKYTVGQFIKPSEDDETLKYVTSWNEYYQSYEKEKQNEIADYIKPLHSSMAEFIR